MRLRPTRLLLSAALAVSAGLGLAVSTAGPAAAWVPDGDMVNAWTNQFLHRDATSADRTDESNVMVWGGRADYVWQLLHGEEYCTQQVSGYYRTLLGRLPDPGADYWVQNCAHNGMALEWIQQNILASDEYAAHKGGTNNPGLVVHGWYSDVLGRFSPSSAEMDYWARQLTPANRLQVLRQIWYSDEAVRRRIGLTYQTELKRTAAPGEVDWWYPKEVESDVNVMTLVASSPEYENHFCSPTYGTC